MPHDLGDTKFWIQSVELNFELVQLLTIHGNLVLALRHPAQQNSRAGSQFAREIVERIETILLATGALTQDDINEAHAGD